MSEIGEKSNKLKLLSTVSFVFFNVIHCHFHSVSVTCHRFRIYLVAGVGAE